MNFMKLNQSVKMAVKSILGNKVRSALTMLGIIIGVSSVILLTGIGGGAAKEFTDSFSELGTKLIGVFVYRPRSSRTIDINDMKKFMEKHPELVTDMSPQISDHALIKVGNDNFLTTLDAVDSNYKDMNKGSTKLLSGRYLNENDIEKRSHVAIVGTYIRDELFGGLDPVGEKIKLNGNVFTVIGLYEEQDDSGEGSADDKVTIPYTTAMRFLKNKNISSFYFLAASEEVVDKATEELRNFVTGKLGSDSFVEVSSVKDMLKMMDEMLTQMTALLAGIAGISLVVGGIGIMNIMTVSVSERTREIGIRKAIGARTTDILMQFLIESVFLSSIGGVIGIGAGIGLGKAAAALIKDLNFAVMGNMVVISFGFSLVVGIFFGLAPARKAARLNPIDALHSD